MTNGRYEVDDRVRFTIDHISPAITGTGTVLGLGMESMQPVICMYIVLLDEPLPRHRAILVYEWQMTLLS